MTLDVKIIIVHRCYLLLCLNRIPYHTLINKSQFRYKAISLCSYLYYRYFVCSIYVYRDPRMLLLGQCSFI